MSDPFVRDKGLEDLRRASRAPGLVPFLTILGAAIERGRSRAAFDALVEIGLEPITANSIIESWAYNRSQQSASGLTPEAILARFLMDRLPHWDFLPWRRLFRSILGETPPADRPEKPSDFQPAPWPWTNPRSG